MRILAAVLILVGLAMPIAIDAYETAYRLDLKRDVGVLPWRIISTVGLVLLLVSLRRRS